MCRVDDYAKVNFKCSEMPIILLRFSYFDISYLLSSKKPTKNRRLSGSDHGQHLKNIILHEGTRAGCGQHWPAHTVAKHLLIIRQRKKHICSIGDLC